MLLSQELANEIVQRSMKIIFHNVNVMQANGVILASGDQTRIGTIHEAGQKAALLGKRIDIYPDEANLFKGVAPGINQPIIVNGEVQMVMGVTGNPNEISRYAELAFLTAELLITQAIQNEEQNWQNNVKDLELSSLVNDSNYLLRIDGRRELELSKLFTLPKLLYIVMLDESGDYRSALHATVKELSRLPFQSEYVVLRSNIFLILNEQQGDFKLQQDIIQKTLSSYDIFFKVGKFEKLKQGITSFKILVAMVRFAIDALSVMRQSLTDSNCIIVNFDDSEYLTSFFLSKATDFEYFRCLKLILESNSQGNKLIETLKAYISSNLEVANTAKKLQIHRNTIQNRFAMIKQLTGLDATKFEDLVIFYLSLAIDDDSSFEN